MSDLKLWSEAAAGNNLPAPNGFPEGMAPSGVNDACREIMAAVRRWADAGGWHDWGHTCTYLSGTSFTVPTDVTAIYAAGRRIKAVGSATGTIYGTIYSSGYAAPNTTVVVTWDSGNLVSEALTISVAFVDGHFIALATYAAIVSLQNQAYVYAIDTSGNDDYAIALSPAVTSLVQGQEFSFKAITANTGPATLTVNGTTQKAIKKYVGGVATDLQTGDILVNQECKVRYDGTQYILMWPSNAGAGYTLHCEGTIAELVNIPDATTYYLGSFGFYASTTTPDQRRIYVPKAGVITIASVYMRTDVLGSAEASSIYIRVNNTTDYLISNAVVNNALQFHVTNAALAIPVAAGDYIEIKWVTPTWATNPNDVYADVIVVVE